MLLHCLPIKPTHQQGILRINHEGHVASTSVTFDSPFLDYLEHAWDVMNEQRYKKFDLM